MQKARSDCYIKGEIERTKRTIENMVVETT